MSVPDEVVDRVAGQPYSAFLATAVDDRPHVAPVWYLYDDGRVYFFTQGRKLANVRRNPRVALAIEGEEAAWLALVRGTATVREDGELRREVADRLFEQYLDDGGAAYRDADGDPQGALVDVEVGSATLREN
ncbi:pyridoxamine 5'-phosphate oxidase family protein [Salinirussus salinus]|uniref:pyridoxamine 5'-phosphate oxidase family protein n=1 Tax=Salinirussus salinus TaxID=1198300 RepID=UPI001358B26D|nr:pyridoxamine 5'-phosphate oxidase family protein [Salinirussus salinus]